MIYVEAFSKVLPVILFFLLGAAFKRTRFISEEAAQGIKKLVINITLPAVLFLAFSSADLQARYLIIIALVFGGCLVVMLASRWLAPLAGTRSPYFPLLMTGFEAGMMGYAIYGAVYGQDNIYKFAIIDLGQVLFVFFVLVTVLQRLSDGPRPFSDTLLNFLKTPVIIGILLGLLANLTTVMPLLAGFPITASVLRTLELLGALTMPLIAMIIGYEMRLQRGRLLLPARAIAVRLAVWIPLGLLLNALVLDRLLHLDRAFQAAVMTMFVLPPPFVMPLFMERASDDERAFVVNALSVATLATLFAFAVISVAYAG